MPDIDTSVTTQQGIDALTARAPKGAQITGGWNGKGHTWVWTVQMPAPTNQDPTAKTGVSRQFVPDALHPTPTADFFDHMVTEMLSTLGGTA